MSKSVFKSKFNVIILFSPFIYVLVINVSTLTPYSFTVTILPSLRFTVCLVIFFSMFINIVSFNYSKSLAHLVPKSSPGILVPALVLIELISLVIRPLTLSLRLIANLMAGHLIMTMISSSLIPFILLKLPVFFSLMLIRVIETAVAIIQAFVLSLLLFLYIKDSV